MQLMPVARGCGGHPKPDPEFAHLLCWVNQRLTELLWERSFFLRDRRF